MSQKSYNTEQKRIIDEYIRKNDDFSCEDILNYLIKNNLKVSMPTVYRYIAKLSNENVLLSVHMGGKKIYRKNNQNLGYATLRCKICGKCEILNCTDLEHFSKHLFKHHNFSLDISNLVLYGVCSDCNKKNQKENI